MSFLEHTTSRQVELLAAEATGQHGNASGFSATTVTATPVAGSWFSTQGCNSLCLEVKYTRAAGTAVLLTFDVSPDNGTTVYQMTSLGVAAGTGTRTQYTDSFTASVSTNYEVRLVDLDFKFMRVTAAITAGTTDTLTITGRRSYKA